MAARESNRYWTTVIIVFLIAFIIIGIIITLSRLNPGQPVTISTPESEQWQGEIYIGGGVNNPGIYSFQAGDTIEDLVRAAGGTANSSNPGKLELQVSEIEDQPEAQRIDVNRAEAWLLEALPGVGETLAQRIVDYRQKNGPFSSVYELLDVAGIGPSVYEKIESMITVAD